MLPLVTGMVYTIWYRLTFHMFGLNFSQHQGERIYEGIMYATTLHTMNKCAASFSNGICHKYQSINYYNYLMLLTL
jgi:hypothetical protein